MTSTSSLRAVELAAEASNKISNEAYASTNVGLLARDLHLAMSRAIDDRVRMYGLTSNVCRYLAIIGGHEGITPKGLSEFLGVRSPTTVAALGTLETKKLVKRYKDRSDGRVVRYKLTHQGAEIEHIVRECALEVERAALASLSVDQVHQLRSVVADVRRALGPLLARPQADDAGLRV